MILRRVRRETVGAAVGAASAAIFAPHGMQSRLKPLPLVERRCVGAASAAIFSLRTLSSRMAALCVILLSLTLTGPAWSQTPTPEQLRMLQSLSPEQQRALAEQYGLSGSQGDGGQADRSLNQPVTSRPRSTNGADASWPGNAALAAAGMEKAAPRIGGGDTVLLDLQRRHPARMPPHPVRPSHRRKNYRTLNNYAYARSPPTPTGWTSSAACRFRASTRPYRWLG